ncbi:hypothetical protein IT774_13595 [Salinimonas marina]|uniref:Tetratricopeptide repeat protein n=1 Tax=Salinimonas marina TaxID=2785918 RepID=A0A7S9HCI7_9ALTE|nr:hypothetical protein [Salinimonas marina]QPG05149.1 hypothetical protein IT774_13595 [Salinimonas marina]
MTSSSAQSKTSPASAPAAMGFRISLRTIRVGLLLGAFILAAMCVRTATTYWHAHTLSTQVQAWFVGDQLPAPGELARTEQQLKQLEKTLAADAGVKLSLARLYIVRGQSETASRYYDSARAALVSARRLQPSHYEALALRVFLDDVQNGLNSEAMVLLEQLLRLSPYEKKVQQLIGPVLVKNWNALSGTLQQLAEPLISSALREASTKAILFDAMRQYNLVAPFKCCSPNRETSAQLRVLEATTPHDTFQ